MKEKNKQLSIIKRYLLSRVTPKGRKEKKTRKSENCLDISSFRENCGGKENSVIKESHFPIFRDEVEEKKVDRNDRTGPLFPISPDSRAKVSGKAREIFYLIGDEKGEKWKIGLYFPTRYEKKSEKIL